MHSGTYKVAAATVMVCHLGKAEHAIALGTKAEYILAPRKAVIPPAVVEGGLEDY